MWKCCDCNSNFDIPETKRPDAGLVPGHGILGTVKLSPVRFCPVCLSTRIENVEGIKTPQERTRIAVASSGNKWAMENFNLTHN